MFLSLFQATSFCRAIVASPVRVISFGATATVPAVVPYPELFFIHLANTLLHGKSSVFHLDCRRPLLPYG